jgi:hypothetical protein
VQASEKHAELSVTSELLGEHPRRGHEDSVDRWLDRSVNHQSSIELARLLYRATDALWERAITALGSVTLTAIIGRVFHGAESKYPFLSHAHGKNAARRVELERIAAVPAAELIEGMRFVLVELLAVIGRLTAEILTPELHAALQDVTPAAPEPRPREASPHAAIVREEVS